MNRESDVFPETGINIPYILEVKAELLIEITYEVKQTCIRAHTYIHAHTYIYACTQRPALRFMTEYTYSRKHGPYH